MRKNRESGFIECITVDPDNPRYKSGGECLLTKDGSTLVAGCKNAVIPFGVKTIGDGAFWGCQPLERIVIPESVTEIGQDAFHHGRKLTTITIPDSVTSIVSSAFLYCSGQNEVRINHPELLNNTSVGSAKIVRKKPDRQRLWKRLSSEPAYLTGMSLFSGTILSGRFINE